MENKIIKADMFDRFTAALIDIILFIVPVFIALIFFINEYYAIAVFFFMLGFAYFLIQDSLFDSQSIGKKILGLQCYNVVEQRVANRKETLIRGAIRFLMTFLFLSIIVDIFAAIADTDNRRFTDHAAGTMIVKITKV